MKRKILRPQPPGAAGRAARERPSGGLSPRLHRQQRREPLRHPRPGCRSYAEAYRSPASLHAGFGFYRAFPADEVFNAAHREPLDVPMPIAGADYSMHSGEALSEAGLKA